MFGTGCGPQGRSEWRGLGSGLVLLALEYPLTFAASCMLWDSGRRRCLLRRRWWLDWESKTSFSLPDFAEFDSSLRIAASR
jgi:hypothetical protein